MSFWSGPLTAMSLADVSTFDSWPLNVFSAVALSACAGACRSAGAGVGAAWRLYATGIDTRTTAVNATPKSTLILFISTSIGNFWSNHHGLISTKVSKVNFLVESCTHVRINPLSPTKPDPGYRFAAQFWIRVEEIPAASYSRYFPRELLLHSGFTPFECRTDDCFFGNFVRSSFVRPTTQKKREIMKQTLKPVRLQAGRRAASLNIRAGRHGIFFLI